MIKDIWRKIRRKRVHKQIVTIRDEFKGLLIPQDIKDKLFESFDERIRWEHKFTTTIPVYPVRSTGIPQIECKPSWAIDSLQD